MQFCSSFENFYGKESITPNMRLRIIGKFFDDIQSTEDYPSISMWEAFKNRVKFKLQPIKILNWLLIGLNTNSSL